MLDDQSLGKLVSEIYSRLTVMEEEFDYEIEVPGRNALLGVVGGGKQSDFRLVPILQEGNSRKELPGKTFTHRNDGTIEVAGQVHPHTKVLSVDQPEVEMYEWLRSDPWTVPS
jgi:hypothetical protein